MTKRRLAVTSRSAAFSSPRWARRARRRSSSGSSIKGSFWMSWRYWSNAVEGDERKYPLDGLVSVPCSIHAPHQGVRRSEHHRLGGGAHRGNGSPRGRQGFRGG